MSSRRRRFSGAKTSRRPCYDRLSAALVGCTVTRARPITGPSNLPAPVTQATSSLVPYLWPWSCPCRPSANLRSPPLRRSKCPMRQCRRGEGIVRLGVLKNTSFQYFVIILALTSLENYLLDLFERVHLTIYLNLE